VRERAPELVGKTVNLFNAGPSGLYTIDIGTATAMAFPSVLSVRYVTAEVVPKLEQAIKAGKT